MCAKYYGDQNSEFNLNFQSIMDSRSINEDCFLSLFVNHEISTLFRRTYSRSWNLIFFILNSDRLFLSKVKSKYQNKLKFCQNVFWSIFKKSVFNFSWYLVKFVLECRKYLISQKLRALRFGEFRNSEQMSNSCLNFTDSLTSFLSFDNLTTVK